MKADVKRSVSEDLIVLLCVVAYVLACGLGYFLGNYFLGEGRIGLWLLILLYVVLFFATGFTGAGLVYVLELFVRLVLPDPPEG
jgi:quinol-cytochrome oxidoreductase complex cytochrome b subunit